LIMGQAVFPRRCEIEMYARTKACEGKETGSEEKREEKVHG
jgi:hypothetical protein